jgi:hypothetical protein
MASTGGKRSETQLMYNNDVNFTYSILIYLQFKKEQNRNGRGRERERD